MSEKALIKEFWKLDDTKPDVWFHDKSAKDKDNFLKFVDTRITKDQNNSLYTKNLQFYTVLQPVFGNITRLFMFLVSYLGVSKYYHERRDTNFLHHFNFFKTKTNLTLGTNIYLYTKNKTIT